MMAEGRRGLGRGLSALLDDAGENQSAGAQSDGTRDIPIELVHRNPDQPRRHFSEAEIGELEASIRDKGVLQPILVRPSPKTPGEYEIVAGERRWRAAQQAGLTAIPALIRVLDDDKAFEIAGYPAAEVEARFGGMLNAFKYGAPPHGGSAPGIDRIVMLLAETPNIREVVAFPMNQQAQDLLMQAPAEVPPERLKELYIRTVPPPSKGSPV